MVFMSRKGPAKSSKTAAKKTTATSGSETQSMTMTEQERMIRKGKCVQCGAMALVYDRMEKGLSHYKCENCGANLRLVSRSH